MRVITSSMYTKRFVVAALALGAFVVAAGCQKAKKKDEGAAATEPGGAEGDTAGPTAAKPQPPLTRPALAPITLEEAKPLIPAIDKARAIKEPQKAQVGERVESAWCVPGELAAV